jgi:hypothetical protein
LGEILISYRTHTGQLCTTQSTDRTAMAYAGKGQAQGNALGLSDDESKALEQTRQRLYQLSNSISSLRQSIVNSNPLPPRQVHLVARHAKC